MLSLFEDVIIYLVVFACFVGAFMPVMNTFVAQGQIDAIANNNTMAAQMMGFIVPMFLVAIILGFSFRAAGKKPAGVW